MSRNARLGGRSLPCIDPPVRSHDEPIELHRNPFIRIHQVRTRFGEFIKDYYVADFGRRAAMVAVDGDRVLLTAQYRYLVDSIVWEIPGGSLDPGENPADAAVRECIEETGIRCDQPTQLVSFRPGLDNVDNQTTIFLSTHIRSAHPFVPNPTEVLALAWLPIEECVSLIFDGTIADCVTVAGVLAYQCWRSCA